jgi:acetyl-CoA C-acetyltransferase
MHLADIVGIGRTKAAEHWNRGLIDLAREAGTAAMAQAPDKPTALVVANALSGVLGDQRNVAVYVAKQLGLHNLDTYNIEADEASGGAALRVALSLIGSGMHETVLVVGAEKTTDVLPDALETARATALDAAREAEFGFSLSIAAALAMRGYIEKYQIDRRQFYHLSAIAHAHGAKNKLAFFAWPLSEEQYLQSPVVSDPITVCDLSPPCDGAAAVLLRRPSDNPTSPPAVRIVGSSSVSVTPGIKGPALDLHLPAAAASASAALNQAKIKIEDVSLFELHDSSTIMAALSLEAVGMAEPGRALSLAVDGTLSVDGARPTWTFGGHKSRGHAIGAAGLYQVVEAALQLRHQAGDNQVPGAKTALVQCLGSFGSTAVTHVLRRA